MAWAGRVVPSQVPQRRMAAFAAQPFGPGLFLRDAAFLVAHLEQPNFTPRAISMDGVNAASPPGAGAALPRAKSAGYMHAACTRARWCAERTLRRGRAGYCRFTTRLRAG